MKKPVYAVVTANVSDIEQREILSGIIKTAQQLDIDIVVISNIYNPIESSDALKAENAIYNLISTVSFNGYILISESIINADLQKIILSELEKKSEIPVVVIGTPLSGLMLPHFHYINSSDEDDLEEITDHLIEVHGFKNIHILTGYEYIDASHRRVEGYKKSLQKHNIQFNSNNIFWGNYWMDSGHEHVKRYLNGSIPFPDALICTNDYMAYGVLDECMDQDIPILDTFTIIGYEYIRERRNHTPLLTTYQRNRKMLGINAVKLLRNKLVNGDWDVFSPPKGTLIKGDSCPCGASSRDIKREIMDVQTKAMYDFLNLFSQLDHRLTECRNVNEFVSCCREFRFMIRNVCKLYMCLYENWYENKTHSKTMIAYNMLEEENTIIFKDENVTSIFKGSAAPYYISPLFFAKRELGFIILSYDTPDVYDHIYRNWLKSIANGLELLHMKNDIQYLTACQNLTEFRDTMTGMLNIKGFENVFSTADKKNLYLITVKAALFNEDAISLNAETKTGPIFDIADSVREFCHNQDVCARMNGNMFVCLVRSESESSVLRELMLAIILQNRKYITCCGADSFVCSVLSCGSRTFADLIDQSRILLDEQIEQISERRHDKHYIVLNRLRKYLYLNPNDTFDSDLVHSHFDGSAGYLRTIYKKCFGISFHQDCINARIAKAKYFLAIKQFTTNQTADICGYSENKYFMRQFLAETKITANNYRRVIIHDNI